MNFRKTILTANTIGFILVASAQSQSPESRSGGTLQPTQNSSKKITTSSSPIKNSDSILNRFKNFNLFPKQEIKTKFKNQFDNNIGKHLGGLKNNFKQSTDKIFNRPVSLEGAEVSYSGVTDTSYWQRRDPYYYGGLEFNSAWSFAGIPAAFGFQNQSGMLADDYMQNNFAFRFDKDAYLQQLKRNMGDKFNPSSLLSSLKDPVSEIKQNAQQLLKSDLSGISRSYNGLLDKEINELGDPSALFSKGMQELRQQFLSGKLVEQANESEKRYSALQQRMNMGEKVDANELSQVKAAALKIRGIQELLQKMEGHKTKLESSGVLKKIKQFELLKKDKLARLMNDPSVIRKQAKQFLSLKGLQRLFLNINRLNIGRDAVSSSPMSLQHFLHNGISTEFLNKKGTPLMLLAGRQKDFNSILDYGFTDNLFSDNSRVMATKIGLGSAGISTSSVAVSSFTQSMGSGLGLPFNTADFRKILVTTVSNQLNIGQKGNISVDLSRSATSYRDNGNNGDSVLKPGSNLSRIFSSENLMANMALALSYSDEFTEQGLSYQFNFNKVSNGYDNPGNTFLNGGSTEVGAQVRKSFLKNKLQFFLRGNGREFKYNDDIDKKWRNTYLVMDAKWRMKKGQYVSVRYQPNRMKRIEEGVKNTVTAIDRMSAEASLFRKLGRTGYRNTFSLTYQRNMYALSAIDNISNMSLQVNSFQNITIGKKLVYANLNYINSDNHSQYVYFNSSLNTDIGISFPVFNRLMASSGVVYSAVDGWYKQAGIRQSLTGDINDKFSVSVYVDARKNLSVIQPIWNSPVRADISIRYLIRNNNEK